MYRTASGGSRFRDAAATAMLLMTSFTGVASVAMADEPLTRTVKVADLNLESAHGREILERRLRIAIKEVCAEATGVGTRTVSRQKHRECLEKARISAQRQLDKHGLPRLLAAGR